MLILSRFSLKLLNFIYPTLPGYNKKNSIDARAREPIKLKFFFKRLLCEYHARTLRTREISRFRIYIGVVSLPYRKGRCVESRAEARNIEIEIAY